MLGVAAYKIPRKNEEFAVLMLYFQLHHVYKHCLEVVYNNNNKTRCVYIS